jgi:hypothetical protein
VAAQVLAEGEVHLPAHVPLSFHLHVPEGDRAGCPFVVNDELAGGIVVLAAHRLKRVGGIVGVDVVVRLSQWDAVNHLHDPLSNASEVRPVGVEAGVYRAAILDHEGVLHGAQRSVPVVHGHIVGVQDDAPIVDAVIEGTAIGGEQRVDLDRTILEAVHDGSRAGGVHDHARNVPVVLLGKGECDGVVHHRSVVVVVHSLVDRGDGAVCDDEPFNVDDPLSVVDLLAGYLRAGNVQPGVDEAGGRELCRLTGVDGTKLLLLAEICGSVERFEYFS